MLRVKTYIAPSTISNIGLGCFAGEYITKGTLIWEFDPRLDRKITKEEFNNLDYIYQQYINTYAYLSNGNYILCIDNARFFNHSIELCNTLDVFGVQETYATRDIKIGEEIFSNYFTFGITKEDKEWMKKNF